MGSGNIKKFELKLGRTGIIIVVAGMIVLLCSSFLLGVTVGKNINTYPEKISSIPQSVLALFWRPAKVAGQQNIVEDSERHSDKGNMDLVFHNALTSQKTPAMQKPLAEEKKRDDPVTVDQKVKSSSPPLAELPKEEAVLTKEKDLEKKVPAGEKSLTKGKSKVNESKLSVPSGGPLFFIHVASMKDKTRANQISKKVVDLGYDAKVVKVDIKGKGTWYRVIAPGFQTKPRAQAAADKISRNVKTRCIIGQAGANTDKKQ